MGLDGSGRGSGQAGSLLGVRCCTWESKLHPTRQTLAGLRLLWASGVNSCKCHGRVWGCVQNAADHAHVRMQRGRQKGRYMGSAELQTDSKHLGRAGQGRAEQGRAGQAVCSGCKSAFQAMSIGNGNQGLGRKVMQSEEVGDRRRGRGLSAASASATQGGRGGRLAAMSLSSRVAPVGQVIL